MSPRLDDLRMPVRRAVRLVALGYLEQAASAHDRLEDPEDAESLHDFRVALRRLRSWLRAFDRYMDDSVSLKTQRRLRKLARATNASRDLEVHLAWLAEQNESLTPRQRVGAAWVTERLAELKRESEHALRAAVNGSFASVRQRIEENLETYVEEIRLHHPAPPTSFAAALAPLVRELAGDLQRRLEAIRSVGDEEEAHAARIAGKRLRYVLDPIDKLVPEAGPLAKRLASLQDSLGGLHDAHVFGAEIRRLMEEGAAEHTRWISETLSEAEPAEKAIRRARRRDPVPGLVAISERLRASATRHFASVDGEWLGGNAEEFFGAVEALAVRLVELARGDTETERKYLLRALPDETAGAQAVLVDQGYLPGVRVLERLRRVTTPDGQRFYRTVKVGDGVSRIELEEETTQELFTRMWPLTRGRRVRKRRYRIPFGDRTWEIDQFLDRELVLAEIELETEDEPVQLPPWIEAWVEREVTEEPEYTNANLAR